MNRTSAARRKRFARALAARRLGRPDHVRKVPQPSYVNIDKTSNMAETPAMVSLLVHAVLGIVVIVVHRQSNPTIFRAFRRAPVSALEIVYYVVGIASIALGWYFNYPVRAGVRDAVVQPDLGAGQLAGVHRAGTPTRPRARPAQDYTIVNVILLPLFTIVDGRRRGIRRPWLFFVSSLFTSFAFA